MVVPTLTRRAEAAGIAPRYMDWSGQQVEVSAETLIAILDALDNVPGASQEPAPSRPRHAEEPAGPDGGDADARPRVPGRRSWGFAVQLYSVRSRRSWGPRDPPDLADLAESSARDLEDWAAWCALAEGYGPDWRSWPGPARDPRRARGVLASGGPGLEPGGPGLEPGGPRLEPGGPRLEPGGPGADPGFHAWLQWL